MKYGRSFITLILLIPLSVKAITTDQILHQFDYGSCLIDTAHHYQVSPVLIVAIIKTESNHDARAININTSGSEDVGLMQINSRWLPHIKAYGYDRESLFDPCTNILVGTWILAQEVRRFGYTWTAVGAYNAGPSQNKALRRSSYATRVLRNLDQ